MIALVNHQGLKVMKGLQLQSPAPSIGLAYLGAYLKQHGLDYEAIDACGLALDRIVAYERNPDVYVQGLSVDAILMRLPDDARIVGMTCLFSHCWPLVVKIAQEIRRVRPKAFLVAGGEHPTALPETALRDGLFDVVVMGEGEETFLELCRCVLEEREWRGVHGLAYWAEGRVTPAPPRSRMIQIDQLPYPDWDRWCLEAYIEHGQTAGINLGRQMPILGSRGCPFDCKFCSSAGMWTQRYVMRGPKSLVDEMQYMKEKYRATGFTFMDSTFVIHRGKTLAFARELIARGLNVTYQLPAGTRCEAFDAELAQALSDSGLRNFAFAPESGSIEILNSVRKKVNLQKLEQAICAVLRTRTTVCCFIVIGFPEDTHATLMKTLGLVRRLARLGVHDLTVSQFTPYPGSDYFRELRVRGLLSRDLSELDDVIDFFSSKGRSYSEAITAPQLYRWMLCLYVNFYVLSFLTHPVRLIKNLYEFLVHGIENTRYMRLAGELFVRRGIWEKKATRQNMSREDLCVAGRTSAKADQKPD